MSVNTLHKGDDDDNNNNNNKENYYEQKWTAHADYVNNFMRQQNTLYQHAQYRQMNIHTETWQCVC